jgi:ribosomal-protein-alanine N-acetyltransferase
MVVLMVAAVDEGAKHMTLEVRSQNQEARALYSSLGFAPVGIRKGYYDDDDALIFWAHDIAPAREGDTPGGPRGVLQPAEEPR